MGMDEIMYLRLVDKRSDNTVLIFRLYIPPEKPQPLANKWTSFMNVLLVHCITAVMICVWSWVNSMEESVGKMIPSLRLMM